MKEVKKSTQFKKDFKRYKNDKEKVRLLFEVVTKLANGEELPKENKPHPLNGRLRQFMECHIEDDYLLIWYDKIADSIELVRLGTHSELYGR